MDALSLHQSKERRRSGLTLIEGPHLLAEAVGASCVVRTVFGLVDDVDSARLSEQAGADWAPVTREVLERLAPAQHPRGPVAVVEIPPPRPADTPRLLVLWGINDPGNAGTMIRTAAAFGVGVIVVGGADVWSPKVLRSAAGGHFHTPIETIPDLGVSDLEARGFQPIATVVRGGRRPWELPPEGRLALLVGEEAHGLPAGVEAACSMRVTIPMPSGTESLNAATATAVILYELGRPGRSQPPH